MYRVLVGIDSDSQRAKSQARAVCELPQAPTEVKAILMHVFQDNPEGASVGQLGAVRRAKEILEDYDVEIELVEGSGSPATELIEVADERSVELLCLSRRKRTPTGKIIFGSTTQSVLLGTDRPVMTVGIGDYGDALSTGTEGMQ